MDILTSGSTATLNLFPTRRTFRDQIDHFSFLTSPLCHRYHKLKVLDRTQSERQLSDAIPMTRTVVAVGEDYWHDYDISTRCSEK